MSSFWPITRYTRGKRVRQSDWLVMTVPALCQSLLFPSLSIWVQCQLCALGRAAQSITKEWTRSQNGANLLPSKIEATHTMTPQAMPGATQQQCGPNEQNISKVKARAKWVRSSTYLQISDALHKNEVYCALSGYLTVCIRGCWFNVSKLCSWHCEIQPFQASEQVRTYLSGWRSFTNTAQVWVGLHLQPLDPSQCWVALYSQSMHCPQAFETPSSLKHSIKKKGGAKNTAPSKSFHLKCSQKCLIQPCVHLDSPIIHLCIFSERQTAESFWYHIRFWASPCPCLWEREGKTGE